MDCAKKSPIEISDWPVLPYVSFSVFSSFLFVSFGLLSISFFCFIFGGIGILYIQIAFVSTCVFVWLNLHSSVYLSNICNVYCIHYLTFFLSLSMSQRNIFLVCIYRFFHLGSFYIFLVCVFLSVRKQSPPLLLLLRTSERKLNCLLKEGETFFRLSHISISIKDKQDRQVLWRPWRLNVIFISNGHYVAT